MKWCSGVWKYIRWCANCISFEATCLWSVNNEGREGAVAYKCLGYPQCQIRNSGYKTFALVRFLALIVVLMM